jgi:hypothetical protein
MAVTCTSIGGIPIMQESPSASSSGSGSTLQGVFRHSQLSGSRGNPTVPSQRELDSASTSRHGHSTKMRVAEEDETLRSTGSHEMIRCSPTANPSARECLVLPITTTPQTRTASMETYLRFHLDTQHRRIADPASLELDGKCPNKYYATYPRSQLPHSAPNYSRLFPRHDQDPGECHFLCVSPVLCLLTGGR